MSGTQESEEPHIHFSLLLMHFHYGNWKGHNFALITKLKLPTPTKMKFK